MITSLGLNKLEPTSLIPKKRILNQYEISESTFERWTNKEKILPTIKVNKKVWVTTKDWNEFVESYRQ